jgi:hypothetical protein
MASADSIRLFWIKPCTLMDPDQRPRPLWIFASLALEYPSIEHPSPPRF